jgi:lysophospholipase L1-like esterase
VRRAAGAGALVLLGLHLRGAVWALPATVAYTGFLLLLVTLALTKPPRHPTPLADAALWLLLAVMLVVAAYTPSGWALWVRATLLLIVLVLSAPLSVSPARYGNLTLMCVTLALTVFATYGADRAVGALTGGRKPGGLVFPRNSVVHYQTAEFAYTAHINRYGFRGSGADLSTDADCRVMLLGDSFTYGWGVDYPQTWGALLEQGLRAAAGHDIDAQVLNLGAPGANTADYATLAETAAPIIEPDVILVGVLQGDDMRQMSREPAPFPRAVTFGDADTPLPPLTAYLAFHYPHIAERTVLSRVSAADVRRGWQATAARFVAGYTPQQRARYDAVPPDIRDLFLSGEISPHLLHFAVTMPDYWAWVQQPPGTLAPYIEDMAAQFAQIKRAAGEARVLVLSVPYGAYTQDAARRNLARLGFDVPPTLLESALVDNAVAGAADAAGVDFLAVTAAFRAEDAPLAFYPLDGHFNAAGNRLFAASIAPAVAQHCAD